MNREAIENLIDQKIDANSAQNQFAVSQVPFHRHNGQDSPLLPFTSIFNRTETFFYTLFGTSPATSGNYSSFFIAPMPITLTGISEVHTVLGTDGSAVTLVVEKLTGTTVPGSGVSVMSNSFNLKGTINTVQNALLSAILPNIQLNTGDRLALKLTGTPTAIANLTVTLTFNF